MVVSFGGGGARLDGKVMGMGRVLYSISMYGLVVALLAFGITGGHRIAYGQSQPDTVVPSQGPLVEPSADATGSTLGIDRLLIPREAPHVPEEERYGGRNQEEWHRAFREARSEIARLEQRVEAMQVVLRETSTGEWGFSPAGGGAPTDPDVLKRRAELKRDRQSLEAARRRLRDLEVESSLAGVPEEWIQP